MEDNEKYDRIEGRLHDMDNRIRKVEIEMASYREVTNRNTEVLEKFSDTLDSVKETMIDISYNTKQNTDVIDKLTGEVGVLNNKVDSIDDKAKIDTSLFWKGNIRVLIDGGGIVAIVAFLYQMIMH